LKEYGAFLYQTPWFRFPFGAKLRQFWHETPLVPSIRAVERRGSLSLQYAARYAYARLMRFVAGYEPADLSIRSVVGGLTPSDLAAMRDVKVIRDVTDASGVRGVLVETARYAAFDAFVKELGRHANASLLEVAGNHHILVTIVAPEGTDAKLAVADGVAIFGLPIQSLPGSRRIGIDLPVRSLVQDVKNIEATGYRLEHAYDY
jgi:hypothetical protein